MCVCVSVCMWRIKWTWISKDWQQHWVVSLIKCHVVCHGFYLTHIIVYAHTHIQVYFLHMYAPVPVKQRKQELKVNVAAC